MAESGGLLNRYTVKSRIGGSNPPLSAIFINENTQQIIGGDVAQLGERLVRNEGVGGSSPLISTNYVHGQNEIVLDGEVAVPSARNPL